MLRKIDSFFNYLNENNVKYCHWKSNTDLDRTLCGMSDIDLLVSRQDRKALASVTQQLGMVKAVAPLRKDMPGIEDYVGFDEESGKPSEGKINSSQALSRVYASVSVLF